jgi:hyperosmotically inducible periplasmic protein
MNRVSIPIFALLVSFLSATCITANAVKQDTQQPAPDNTKTNKSASPTADQQKMNASDRDMTKKIRMAIHDDKSMSTYGHNVKIITQNGKVTLKGPVHSEEEKANIAAKATSIAGDGNVDNQIDVVPAKQ